MIPSGSPWQQFGTGNYETLHDMPIAAGEVPPSLPLPLQPLQQHSWTIPLPCPSTPPLTLPLTVLPSSPFFSGYSRSPHPFPPNPLRRPQYAPCRARQRLYRRHVVLGHQALQRRASVVSRSVCPLRRLHFVPCRWHFPKFRQGLVPNVRSGFSLAASGLKCALAPCDLHSTEQHMSSPHYVARDSPLQVPHHPHSPEPRPRHILGAAVDKAALASPVCLSSVVR